MDEDTLDRMQLITPETTFGEGVSAAFDLAKFDTALDSIISGNALNDLKAGESSDLDFTNNKGRTIPRDELNEKYPEMDKPFTEDMNEYAAFLIAERHKEKTQLMRKINDGPDTFFYGLTKFGAQMVPHALDPIELGAGILGGYVLGGGAAALGGARALGIGASGRLAVGATATQRFLNATADGIIGNILVEPFIANNAGNFQENYTLQDSFMSVTAGAVGFAAFSSLARVSVNMFKYATNPVDSFAAKTSSKANDILYKSTLGQILQGRSPKLNSIVDDFVDVFKIKSDAELSGIVRPDDGAFYIANV